MPTAWGPPPRPDQKEGSALPAEGLLPGIDKLRGRKVIVMEQVGQYRPATAKDLIAALKDAGMIEGGKNDYGISVPKLALTTIAKALVDDSTSAALEFVQLPGIFVKVEEEKS